MEVARLLEQLSLADRFFLSILSLLFSRVLALMSFLSSRSSLLSALLVSFLYSHVSYLGL